MKKIIFIMSLLLSLSTFFISYANKIDPSYELQSARKLTNEGKYEEALKKFIWFHNHALEYKKSLYGVRISFALSYWKELADVYPKALKYMKNLTENNMNTLSKGKYNSSLWDDIIALNKKLGQQEKTIALFEKLDKEHHNIALKYWSRFKDVAFENKKFNIIKRFLTDPQKEYEKILKKYNDLKYSDKKYKLSLGSFPLNNFTEKVIQLLTYLIAINDSKNAHIIKRKAIKINNTNLFENAIGKALLKYRK